MARLLIVSRSMALAMRLADQHDVVEHPVDQLDRILPEFDADVLVLDLGDPVLAVNTVNGLRESERDIPVLLVSGYQPEWEQVEAQDVEGVHVVPLPITRMALLHGVAVLTGTDSPISFVDSDGIEPAPEPGTDPAPDGDSAAEAQSPGTDLAPGPAAESEDGSPDGGEADRHLWSRGSDADLAPAESPDRTPGADPSRGGRADDVRSTADPVPTGPFPVSRAEPARGGMGRRVHRLGNRPRKLQRHPSVTGGEPVAASPQADLGLVTDPLGPRTDPSGVALSDLERRLDAEAAELTRTAPLVGETALAVRTSDLVRMLYERGGDLYGVNDTAQVLADDVVERADADAAAVLVPDGPVWRVSGGVGLRPLERRLILQDSHWLITEIGSAGRAVLIEDTDIVRQQLAGTPLAAWRHLLAVPVPEVRGIVVLARGQEGGPFSDRDLAAVISPVREAATLLSQAVETRRLARMLAPLRELEAEGPVPRGNPER